jgi:hypothetical protein
MPLMAETAFRVAYEGPALATGRMPVRDLAPALLALGDLFTEASQVVYEDAGPVALSIKATERGSFDVQLILEGKELWDQFTDIFGGQDITALVNLQTLIIGGKAIGLFELIRILGGQRPSEEPTTAGMVRLTVGDVTLEVPPDLWKMYRRVSIRRKARDVVAPLRREGVERVEFEDPAAPDSPVVIEEEDVPAYEEAIAEEEDVLSDEEREMWVQIAAVSFEGRKWRLSEGNLTFWATIEDDRFLTDVDEAREHFAAGDMLRCRIRIVQTRRPGGGLQTEYHVLEVLEHQSAHTQPELWE